MSDETGAERAWVRFVHRHGFAIALVIALVTTFLSIGNHEIWTPDEPREAQIGKEMLASGFSAMPTLCGEPFVEKPPLFAWAMAASYAVFGVGAGPARVPAAAASALAIVLAFLLARRAAGSVAGVAAAAVLATTSKFASTGGSAVLDTALTAFVAGGHLCLVHARDAPRRMGPYLAAGVFCALAFMTKAVIGPVLILAPPFVALLVLREWRTLGPAVWRVVVYCVAPTLIAAALWVGALVDAGGWAVVREGLVNNTVARFGGDAAREFGDYGHDKPFWYYLKAFPSTTLPWSLVIPALLASAALGARRVGGRPRFLALTVLAGVVLLSLPSGKRTLYLMPLLPAAAAVCGVWLARAGTPAGTSRDRPTLVLMTWLLAIASAGLGALFLVTAIVAPPIAKLTLLRENDVLELVLVGVGCLAVAAGVAWLARDLWRRFGALAVRRVVAVGVVLTAIAAVVGRPLLDPSEEMRSGALRVGQLVGRDHALVGLDIGETERAVLAYYNDRPVTALSRRRALDRLVDEEGLRQVVIEGGRRGEPHKAALAGRFEVEERVRLGGEDYVEVLRLKEPR